MGRFGHLVCFVHLVRLVESKKRDKPNNGLLMLADCFSVLLVAYFEHQVEAKTHEENVRHPAGNQRSQDSAAAESDRDGVCRPKAEADGERLPNAHRHAAPSSPTPAQTQRNADQNHDYGNEWERDSAVIVRFKPCGLRAFLVSTSGIGPDIMERHQLGVAGEPCGEVIGNEG
jgi:hypothetical protein